MRRLLCLLTVLLLLPCAALAEELTLMAEYPIQSEEPIAYPHDAHLLPDGNLLLRYYTLDRSEFIRNVGMEGKLYTHCMGIFTPEGEKVWERSLPSSSYELAKEQNDDMVIIRPNSFIREYGPAQSFCSTEYDLSGNVLHAQLEPQARENAPWVWSSPRYGITVDDSAGRTEALSLATGAAAELPVDELGIISAAEVDGKLAVLNRPEDEPAVIRLYDENLTELRMLTVPFDYGEWTPMAYANGILYCFPLYTGDWESYYAYACDLQTGQWLGSPVYVTMPDEHCHLSGIIPGGGGCLLLIYDDSTAPFRDSGNFNHASKRLYRMAPNGSLSLCLDLNGDALLLPQTQADQFTLLMPSGAADGYVLRTYALE